MSYLGNAPESVFTEMKYQDLTGGSGTSFTLNQAVSNPQEIEVFVNNVRQEPSASYSVSGTTLTMTESVGASEDFYVVFQGMAQGSATHPATQSLEAASVTSTGAISGTTITGTSFVSSGNMTFADNNKAVFGSGSDLEIFHDTGNSFIKDTGTGDLVLRTNGNNILLQNSNNQNMIRADSTNGEVKLFHGTSSGTEKLATTSSGVNITGTGTFSGAVPVNSGEIKATSGAVVQESNGIRTVIGNDGGSGTFGTSTNHQVKMFTNNVNVATLTTGGNFNILDGDLVIGTSGHGISFAATSDASGMSSEVLDDYEEGTFTPTASTAGSYQYRAGRYTKIGRIVHIQVEMRYVQSGTTHGNIGGFPFALRETNYLSVFIKEYNSTGHGFHTHMSVGNTSINNLRKVDGNSNVASDSTVYGWGFFLTYETY